MLQVLQVHMVSQRRRWGLEPTLHVEEVEADITSFPIGIETILLPPGPLGTVEIHLCNLACLDPHHNMIPHPHSHARTYLNNSRLELDPIQHVLT